MTHGAAAAISHNDATMTLKLRAIGFKFLWNQCNILSV